MKDPIRETISEAFAKLRDAFSRLGDSILIELDELKHIVYGKQFWLGTLMFGALTLVLLMDV